MRSRRGEATILHADLDSFYASVEQRDDPALRGKPVLVGQGLVLAASYEAKAYGVSCPMGTSAAKRLCPDAIAVPVRWEAYSEASKDVFEIFHDTSPAVEALSPDEAFLDARGMERIAGTPRQIAERLRARVREEVGLPITVGIASTKFLAKVASAVGKPDGLLVVPAGEELEFLHALPVERLWGVGPATRASCTRTGSGGWRRSPRWTSRRSWRCSAGRPGASCTRSRTTATRGGCRPGRGGARSGRRTRSGGARGTARRPSSTRCWSGSSTASGGACARRTARAGRSRCGCGSTTSRA